VNAIQSAEAPRVDRIKSLVVRARALIFDVDGTLAETEELHRQAFNEAFARTGLDWRWGERPVLGGPFHVTRSCVTTARFSSK